MILTAENYFSTEAAKEYMSVSQFKAFEECQSKAMAEINGIYEREMTASLLVGSYVDAYFEGTLDVFKAKYPQILKKDGVLKAEYAQAERIIERIKRDELFMKFMSGKKQVIMTGEIEGIPIKIKIDVLHDEKIVDLKIMKDFEPIYRQEQGKLPWYEAWKYDLQGAVYQEIVRQNTDKVLPFYLAAATKEKSTDIALLEVGKELMEFELAKFTEKLPFYDAIKKGIIEAERCEKCDYCKETKILTKPIRTEELF